MPRFVILEHDHPALHWDFMLEEAGALATWRLLQPPPDQPLVLTAERIADHRLAYLDYEGPIGGGRGSVKRWDRGEYVVRSEAPRQIELRGERWRGTVQLDGLRDNALAFGPLLPTRVLERRS